MTNEEALTWLKNKQSLMTQNRWYFQTFDVEANEKAINALEKIINEHRTCENCVHNSNCQITNVPAKNCYYYKVEENLNEKD